MLLIEKSPKLSLFEELKINLQKKKADEDYFNEITIKLYSWFL